jgi:hypothetical protein
MQSTEINNLTTFFDSAEGIRSKRGVFSGKNQEICVKSRNRVAYTVDLSGKTGTS